MDLHHNTALRNFSTFGTKRHFYKLGVAGVGVGEPVTCKRLVLRVASKFSTEFLGCKKTVEQCLPNSKGKLFPI